MPLLSSRIILRCKGISAQDEEHTFMNTCLKGSIGEVKVMSRLIESGWEVFTPFSGHSPFDLIAVQPITNKLFRVSVKSCFQKNKQSAYGVRLSQICMTVNGPKVENFKQDSCDIVACYLGDIDKVCFISSEDIKTNTVITFREEATTANVTGQVRLIDDYIALP